MGQRISQQKIFSGRRYGSARVIGRRTSDAAPAVRAHGGSCWCESCVDDTRPTVEIPRETMRQLVFGPDAEVA